MTMTNKQLNVFKERLLEIRKETLHSAYNQSYFGGEKFDERVRYLAKIRTQIGTLIDNLSQSQSDITNVDLKKFLEILSEKPNSVSEHAGMMSEIVQPLEALLKEIKNKLTVDSPSSVGYRS